MKFSTKIIAGVAATVSLAVAGAVFAHQGGGMGHGTGPGMGQGMGQQGQGMMMRGGAMMGGMQRDAATHDDMMLVRDMVINHEQIKCTVTNLPNGIRTVTESDDAAVAKSIQAHVASMEGRLADGRVFNRSSENLPVLFDAKDKLTSKIEMTAKGAIVTQTSADLAVVKALQAHAQEVSELARDGRAAMMRSAMVKR
jgi:hypothetical protein